MSNDNDNPFSLQASTDLSASQYCAVVVDGNGQLALPSAGAKIVGVLQTKAAAAGRAATIRTFGMVTKAKLSATVNAGDSLKVDTAGAFLPVAGSTELAMAIALEDGASGDLRKILLVAHRNTIV